MIRIKRDTNPPKISVYLGAPQPDFNGATMTKAELEVAAAAAFFTDAANYKDGEKITKKSFPFRIYKNTDLSKELEKIFGNKCAYCESQFGHVTPKDVEHFRPKNEVDTGTGKLKPGYWWLAGDWKNLLVSCPDCNRPRKHRVPGQHKATKLGKGTQFPLSDEGERIRSHKKAITAEEPYRLLLNPCADNPADHLTFDDDGLIHPRKDAAGNPSAQGVYSINVYALQRKVLVERRLAERNRLRLLVESLKRHAAQRALLDANAPAGLKEFFDNELRQMKQGIQKILAPGAEYLAMKREYIKNAKAAGEFDDLVRCGIDPVKLLGE